MRIVITVRREMMQVKLVVNALGSICRKRAKFNVHTEIKFTRDEAISYIRLG